jgi:hypothetical protein
MYGKVSIDVLIAVSALAFGLGGAVGMFIVACFAVRNYNREYKNGHRDSEMKKIQAGDILESADHAG